MLTAIHQHFLHARLLKHLGQTELADCQYKLSIESMRYADMLVNYLIAHGLMPDMQELDRLRIGRTAEEMMLADHDLAESALMHIDALLQKHDEKEALQLLSVIKDSCSQKLIILSLH